MALITLENVSVSFEGIPAVEDASFEIQPGDNLVLVGDNGSGKSTLLRAMLGLVHLRSGRIVFGDGLTQNAIGYLPQQTALQRDFPASVDEVVQSGCINRMGFRMRLSRNDRKRIDEQLEMLNITAIRKSSYRDLSGGQQQRVLLARALCATNTLLLLDEPVTGLDPSTAVEMYDIIARLNRERGVAIVMISHDVQSALRDAQHVLVMDRGVDFFGDVSAYQAWAKAGVIA